MFVPAHNNGAVEADEFASFMDLDLRVVDGSPKHQHSKPGSPVSQRRVQRVMLDEAVAVLGALLTPSKAAFFRVAIVGFHVVVVADCLQWVCCVDAEKIRRDLFCISGHICEHCSHQYPPNDDCGSGNSAC